ncbi:hypothetical protein [Sanguibacter antarcticus]|uniref:Uncharacterized protein n=1 Tax=Sanguibacter antarcticus TaxID=372484 RepID=A0A2A9E3V1_9MICO|nr:hypothetical protein [Sanguibacter antarcticus]PFG33035.1 hypothetical protein ATL42_0887 [Sanguibacter antarcticus]
MKTATTTSLFEEPDLFDLLVADDEPDAIHCILPNMAIACGRDLLELTRSQRITRRRLTTLTTTETTCPQCLALGDLRAMQNRQAPEVN